MELDGTPAPPTDFHRVCLDEIRRAIALYLEIAYEDRPIPEAVSRRTNWETSDDPNDLFNKSPFEKVGKGQSGCPIVALRLGNYSYPHMKFQVQTWTCSHGFLLSVNTHDQVAGLDPNSPDFAAFKVLQAENQRLKQAIESAWDHADLPTFHGYLRDYLAATPPSGETPIV
jgi:hypothetical protein